MRRLVAGLFVVAGCAPPDLLVLPETPGDSLLFAWQNENGNQARVFDPADDSIVNFGRGRLWMTSLPGQPAQLQLTTGRTFNWGERAFTADWNYEYVHDGKELNWKSAPVPEDMKLPAFDLGRCLKGQGGLVSQSCLKSDTCDVFGSPACVPIDIAAEDFDEPQVEDPVCFPGWQTQAGQACRPPPNKDRPCPQGELMAQGESGCRPIWDRVALPAPSGTPVFYVEQNAAGGPGCGDVNQPCATLAEFEGERANQSAVVELRGQHEAVSFSGAVDTLIRGDGTATLTGEIGVANGALLIIQQTDIQGRVVAANGGSVRLLQVNVHSSGAPAIEMTGDGVSPDLLVVSESRLSADLPPTVCRANEEAEDCIVRATVVAQGLDSVTISSSELQGDINLLARDVTHLEVINSRLLTEESTAMSPPASAGIHGFRVAETAIEATGIYNAAQPAVSINNKEGDIATTVDLSELQVIRSMTEDYTRPFGAALVFQMKDDAQGEHRLSVDGLFGARLGTLLYAEHFDEVELHHVFGELLRGGIALAGRRRIDALVEDAALAVDQDPALRVEAAGEVVARRFRAAGASIHEVPQDFGTIVGTRRAVKGIIDSEGFGRAIPRFTGESLVLTSSGTALFRGSFEDITLTDSVLEVHGDWIMDQADNFAGPRVISLQRVRMSSDLAGLRQPDASLRATNVSFSVGPAPEGVGPLVCSAIDRVYDFRSVRVRHSNADNGLFWLLAPISGLEVERPLLRDSVLELGGESPQFGREVETCVTDSLGETLSVRAHQVALEAWVAQ